MLGSKRLFEIMVVADNYYKCQRTRWNYFSNTVLSLLTSLSRFSSRRPLYSRPLPTLNACHLLTIASASWPTTSASCDCPWNASPVDALLAPTCVTCAFRRATTSRTVLRWVCAKFPWWTPFLLQATPRRITERPLSLLLAFKVQSGGWEMG